MDALEQILTPYIDAETRADAEAALDRLCAEVPAGPRADCYESLAEIALEEGDLGDAIRLKHKAIVSLQHARRELTAELRRREGSA